MILCADQSREDRYIKMLGCDYEDGQQHRRQGLITFPAINTDEIAGIEVETDQPGMRKRYFMWDLPIPTFTPEPEDKADV